VCKATTRRRANGDPRCQACVFVSKPAQRATALRLSSCPGRVAVAYAAVARFAGLRRVVLHTQGSRTRPGNSERVREPAQRAIALHLLNTSCPEKAAVAYATKRLDPSFEGGCEYWSVIAY
jgi:hypothetical protein